LLTFLYSFVVLYISLFLFSEWESRVEELRREAGQVKQMMFSSFKHPSGIKRKQPDSEADFSSLPSSSSASSFASAADSKGNQHLGESENGGAEADAGEGEESEDPEAVAASKLSSLADADLSALLGEDSMTSVGVSSATVRSGDLLLDWKAKQLPVLTSANNQMKRHRVKRPRTVETAEVSALAVSVSSVVPSSSFSSSSNSFSNSLSLDTDAFHSALAHIHRTAQLVSAVSTDGDPASSKTE
jgi:hypothetical protein